MRKILETIIPIIIVFILIATNPDKSDFVQFMAQNLMHSQDGQLTDEDKDIETLASGFINTALDKVTADESYGVFSKFTVDTSVLRMFGSDVPNLKFIGIGNQFIPYGETVEILNKLSTNSQQEVDNKNMTTSPEQAASEHVTPEKGEETTAPGANEGNPVAPTSNNTATEPAPPSSPADQSAVPVEASPATQIDPPSDQLSGAKAPGTSSSIPAAAPAAAQSSVESTSSAPVPHKSESPLVDWANK